MANFSNPHLRQLAVAVPVVVGLASTLYWFLAGPQDARLPGKTTRAKRTRRNGKPSHPRAQPSRGESAKPLHQTTSPYYPPGLNNCGNTCFMNSVLQALAALPSLYAFLCVFRCYRGTIAGDQSMTPVEDLNALLQPTQLTGWKRGDIIDALLVTLQRLLRLKSQPTSFAPYEMLKALSYKAEWDAQELFQLLSSALLSDQIESPAPSSLLDVDTLRLLSSSVSLASPQAYGLEPLPLDDATALAPQNESSFLTSQLDGTPEAPGASLQQTSSPDTVPRSPFLGIGAQRISCMQCGYTAAIRHFTFDSLSLHLPLQQSCDIRDCFREYTKLDTIEGFTCQRCLVTDTLAQLDRTIEIETARSQPSSNSTTLDSQRPAQSPHQRRHRRPASRPKLSTLQSQRNELAQALKANTIEHPAVDQLCQSLPTLLSANAAGSAPRPRFCTKQIMLARLPLVLCLHFSRSIFHPSGQSVKNPCQIRFPERLDLSDFSTGGHLETRPQLPLSSVDERPSTAATATQSEVDATSNSGDQSSVGAASHHQYQLQAVLVHRGSHSSGHFITFRRSLASQEVDTAYYAQLLAPDAKNWLHARLALPELTTNPRSHQSSEPVRSSSTATTARPASYWYRISDESVQKVALAQVLAAGDAYMLFYQRQP
ncbi:ubiquitin-specific protease ubp1 [Dimargaris verticillata]|uniref:Ubiquitin carboxyl-terminal hydrolase n=1 Tax=Dimargaris verticillata TaxID=2761393 RepID=A0A9W8EDV8_9FUNG|nr:ubiquitin-specific protease ubp1 [Dimargaris verticillata]